MARKCMLARDDARAFESAAEHESPGDLVSGELGLRKHVHFDSSGSTACVFGLRKYEVHLGLTPHGLHGI